MEKNEIDNLKYKIFRLREDLNSGVISIDRRASVRRELEVLELELFNKEMLSNEYKKTDLTIYKNDSKAKVTKTFSQGKENIKRSMRRDSCEACGRPIYSCICGS
jgi:hypothetical protein